MYYNKFYENFVPPPEAPTFTPTDEEFKDPLAYLAKIKPNAEKYGVIKIKPPPSWTPPFAIDIKNFRFTPRLQKLNELDALSRMRLNFLDSIIKFWSMQGIELKIPTVENKLVDLYRLRKTVQEYGGFEVCCAQRKWAEIAKRMNSKPNKGPIFRDNYEKILSPYDLHESGVAAEHAKGAPASSAHIGNSSNNLNNSKNQNSAKCPLRMRSRMTQCSTAKEVEALMQEFHTSRELKKLEFYGAPGPKSTTPVKCSSASDSGFSEEPSQKNEPEDENDGDKKDESSDCIIINEILTDEKQPKPESSEEQQQKQSKNNDPMNPIDLVLCKYCRSGDDEHCLLLCDTCDHSFHTYCLLPPLNNIPKGDWRCPKCITEEVKKPREAYGFAQAERVYTLHSFGEMADRFKTDYFGMPSHLVPCSSVEKEFWRLVNQEGEGLTVEYGADLLTDDVGSGFPKMTDKHLDAEAMRYAKSPWNLNNLPVLKNSVLSHISVDISGMKVPWVYVGMCFSTFCWHTEDHWSHSINYLHWGEPKTWYAVSGLEAEQFEAVMKEIAPELFVSQPDLLHHLVTIANPRLLMDKGVRIHTVCQSAGEYVVTFPRAYHAGFNQGYNFAEAVNFCPPDWLAIGRRCVEHYSNLCRMCVFSHDELITKIAAACDQLEIEVASATRDDFSTMIDGYTAQLEKVKSLGVQNRCHVLFELIPDEERLCCVCTTTCFLSAVKCQCSKDKLACLKHFDGLCSTCPPSDLTVNYRYEVDELKAMLNSLNARMCSFDDWSKNVKAAFEARDGARLEFAELKRLYDEAEKNNYPRNELRKSLHSAIKQINKCMAVADQLVAQKISPIKSTNNGRSNLSRKLRLEEVEDFAKNLDQLCCQLSQCDAINAFINKVRQFKIDCSDVMSSVCDLKYYDADIELKLTNLQEQALSFDLHLPEIPKIKLALSSLLDLKMKFPVDPLSQEGAAAAATTTGTDTNFTPIKSEIDSSSHVTNFAAQSSTPAIVVTSSSTDSNFDVPTTLKNDELDSLDFHLISSTSDEQKCINEFQQAKNCDSAEASNLNLLVVDEKSSVNFNVESVIVESRLVDEVDARSIVESGIVLVEEEMVQPSSSLLETQSYGVDFIEEPGTSEQRDENGGAQETVSLMDPTNQNPRYSLRKKTLTTSTNQQADDDDDEDDSDGSSPKRPRFEQNDPYDLDDCRCEAPVCVLYTAGPTKTLDWVVCQGGCDRFLHLKCARLSNAAADQRSVPAPVATPAAAAARSSPPLEFDDATTTANVIELQHPVLPGGEFDDDGQSSSTSGQPSAIGESVSGTGRCTTTTTAFESIQRHFCKYCISRQPPSIF